MGLELLPDELMLILSQQWPCREQQLRQVSALFAVSPPALVIYGPTATAKSGITKAYLEASKLKYAYVRCRECVTGRHLLERTVAAVQQALSDDGSPTSQGRCETISALAALLQRLLAKEDKFILVFDDMDRQREAPPTLLPALARLGEFVRGLTTVLIVRYPSPRFLHQTGVPHLEFPAYNRAQSLHILAQEPLNIFLEPPLDDVNYDDEVHEEDKQWLWPRFCEAIWASLAQNAARDFTSFRDVCHKLWRPFVAPILKGDFGTRDFSRLLVAQRRLFQDESVLLHSIIATSETAVMKKVSHELPFYAKWLLIAAYLASYNPAKLDALYFMKSHERKRRKKGGGTAKSSMRPGQVRKISRHLLGASAFTLDRLLAILHAILPHDLRSTIDVYAQIATLTSLRLLVRGGIGGSDALEPGGKLRTGQAVTWEYAQSLARDADFGLLDYVAE
ncbi:hypothetical protein LTR62_007806 [Meristemomyces frigidus]|uniref:Orc1-like AAA ATPase domain-containing protein n=1 Tax=Meristemomyces frigidus TaxID=1508187 RepID=A0AAN7YDB4_9PEZI|nr:hypothetical protein LTR62_007806 [Meristemomyces frigidus]